MKARRPRARASNWSSVPSPGCLTSLKLWSPSGWTCAPWHSPDFDSASVNARASLRERQCVGKCGMLYILSGLIDDGVYTTGATHRIVVVERVFAMHMAVESTISMARCVNMNACSSFQANIIPCDTSMRHNSSRREAAPPWKLSLAVSRDERWW